MKKYKKVNMSVGAYSSLKLLSDKSNKPISTIMDEIFCDNLNYLICKFPNRLNLFYDLSVNGIEFTIKLRGQTYNMASGHFSTEGLSEKEVDLKMQAHIENAFKNQKVA